MSPEHLFDAELDYRPGLSPIASDSEGQLVGSGEGVVRGERLDGTLRWTLFELPSTLVCPMNPMLNGRLAVWEGEFDAKEERARYRAYAAAELAAR